MSFDVFQLRESVVGEYQDYFRSFVNIADDDIARFVNDKLDTGELWPDPVLQLNPGFEPGRTLGQLANEGVIHENTARLLGASTRLHRHQEQALALAQGGRPYVVTTGTGSGKSLTYLLPIIDAVFRDDPARASVRAIIIYPMNALINSQLESLQAFQAKNWTTSPLTFARYTGQDRRQTREAILAKPPHILLTNYVMADYIMILSLIHI